jgi:DNA-binding CsgD family transcriptional regulator
VTHPRIVGRVAEVSRLEDAVRAVSEGRGGTIHVVGEAGAGKTTLLESVRRRAADDRLLVCATTVDETDQRRRLASAVRLLPTLADGASDASGDPVGAALKAIDALGGPAVIVIDDVQWIDAASAEVLAAIANRSEDLGVLLVTASRPHTGAARQLSGFERAVDRRGERLLLAPLTPHEVGVLVEQTLGAPPSPALADLLLGASGNPFLSGELLRGLDREGALTVVDGLGHIAADVAIPATLGERLAREALAYAAADSLLIRAAAVIAGGFTAEELAAIVDRRPVDVLAELLALADDDVLHERDGRLTFRHDIIRQAIVEATPTPLVRSLNRRAAALLTASGADRTRIAGCLLIAADLDDPHDVAALVELGLALREERAYAAADVLQRALDGLPSSDPRFVEVALALGWALADLGRLPEVGAVLDLLDDRDQMRLDVRRLRGNALSVQGQLAQDFAPLPDDFDIDASFDDVDVDAVDLVAELSTFEIISGRVDRAQGMVDWVRRKGVAVGPVGEVHLGMTVAWLHARDGMFEAGLEVAERATSLANRTAEHESSRVTPASITAIMLDQLGRGDEALQLLRATQDAPGPKWTKPLLQFGAAVILYRRGAWDDSQAEIGAGLASAEEYGVRLGTAWPHALQVMIATARGEHAGANSWLERARIDVPPSSLGVEWLMHAAAMLAEVGGDPRAALDLLRPTIEVALARQAPAVLLNLSPDAARLAATLGDGSTLQQVIDNLDALTSKSGSPVVHAFHDWTVAWQRGRFELAGRAATTYGNIGRGFDAARASHDAAVIAAASEDTDAARRYAGAAFATYESLRAQHLHARLRSGLRAHDVLMRPRRSAPRATIGWDALTDTERRIVDMVGDGLANGTIAERLFVSRRTVESHLARVYQKLGYTRRSELVVGVREHREHSDVAADPFA